MNKQIKINAIIKTLNPETIFLNNENIEINEVIKYNIDNTRNDVIYWININNNEILDNFNNGTIICSQLPLNYKKTNCNYLVFKNPRKAFHLLLENFFKEDIIYKVSNSAIIDEFVILSNSIQIGENVIIEKNCILGKNVKIGHNTVILKNTKIGNNVTIGCNNTIGGNGFGYIKNEKNEFEFINHLGGVLINDNVEVGNNSCIDRAVLGNTIIGEGTKIDNLVHIAHNVEIGKNCAIIANSMIGGSTIISDNTWVAPSTSLRDAIKVEKNSLIGMGAIVLNNIPENEIWVGNPAKKIKSNK